MTKATNKQIRDHYKAQDYDVRIGKDGYISYRYPAADALWKCGRWASEYRVINGHVVLV